MWCVSPKRNTPKTMFAKPKARAAPSRFSSTASSSAKKPQPSTFHEAGYPRRCDLCPPSLQFRDRFEFAHHLRAVHCTREGGSFICKYGRNGVCQTLPLEGVSDNDYEVHLRKNHLAFANDPLLPSFSNESIAKRRSTAASVSTEWPSEMEAFTVHSFTQNLSSVLADPGRSRSESLSFFTRHWGESFVARTSVHPSPNIPRITIEHFRSYLGTTGKKHGQYMRAKRTLQRTLARHDMEGDRLDANEVPKFLLDPKFSLEEQDTFAAVFLEPVDGQPDPLYLPESGRPQPAVKVNKSGSVDVNGTGNMEISRPSSADSLARSVASLNFAEDDGAFDGAPKTADGRKFRHYTDLQRRLEYYHDLVDVRLNIHLSNKSDAFWKAVSSYSSLHGQMSEALEKAAIVRKNLKTIDVAIVDRQTKMMNLHRERANREHLLKKLQDIYYLHKAQMTVQMLLNQNDFPKALECIETAQDVLSSDLKGVVCFRYLSSQLHELYRVIGRMLQEEFVQLIQKELGRPCESEFDTACPEGQLHPIVLGLLRVREYRFVQVLREEIVVAVKNTLRQVVKHHIVAHDELTEFDPTLGNLGDQMRKMDFEQWLSLLTDVLQKLYLICRRVQGIQDLIFDNIEHSQQLNIPAHSPSPSTRSEHSLSPAPVNDDLSSSVDLDDMPPSMALDANIPGETSTPVLQNASALLAIVCRDTNQLKSSIRLLVVHAAQCAQERSCRVIMARSKDGFLERCAVEEFQRLVLTVNGFVESCSALATSCAGNGEEIVRSGGPLKACIQTQSTRFVARFHEERKAKLGNILDSEHWKQAEVPALFQRIVDECERTGILRNVDSDDAGTTNPQMTATRPTILVKGQSYAVVGTALLLLQMLAEYCEAVSLLPTQATELLTRLVELLKSFNSRSCQLILGAGALQLIGLKTISVRNLALASRCLELIEHFIPIAEAEFEKYVPVAQKSQLRHVASVRRDYQDHIYEITNKLVSVLDHHTYNCIQQWELKGSIPSPSFQMIAKHLRKFHDGLIGVLSDEHLRTLFVRVHDSFNTNIRNQLQKIGVTPHDSLTFGLACSDYNHYMETLKSLPCCHGLRGSLSEILHPPSSSTVPVGR